jgi:YHS domain-containing protein
MSEEAEKLELFQQRLQDRLSAANRQPQWLPGAEQAYMAASDERGERFTQLAHRLMEHVIRPRLVALANAFRNASLADMSSLRSCQCNFGYCERFPVYAKLEIGLEHDLRWEKAFCTYKLHMSPVFIKFSEQDKLDLPLEHVDECQVADWVEARLLDDFLSAYVQIDRGQPESDEDVVADPVCGMRLSRSAIKADGDYLGHSYFFCSSLCAEKFEADPTAYVKLKMM